MNSISLNQGTAFVKKQSQSLRANPSNTSKDIQNDSTINITSFLPYRIQEGAANMEDNKDILEGSKSAQISNATLNDTEITSEIQSGMDRLNDQYQKALKVSKDAQEKYNSALLDDIHRKDPKLNHYLGNNIRLNDGTLGYLSAMGNFQPYTNINKTAGKNGCPSKGQIKDVSFGLGSLNEHRDIMIMGTNKKPNHACGNEGNNIFVSRTIDKQDPSFVGCFQTKGGGMVEVNPVIDNFEDCKKWAMNNGYKYFGFKDGDPVTQRSKCMVGNDLNKIKSGGGGNIYNIKPLWSMNSNGSGKRSAFLATTGQLLVLDRPNGKGTIVGRMPGTPAAGCDRGGALKIISSTYGENCNAMRNYWREAKCYSWGWWGCRHRHNVTKSSAKYRYVSHDNALARTKQLVESAKHPWYKPIDVPIGSQIKESLTRLWLGFNNGIFGDPAPGCPKKGVLTYQCGSNPPKTKTIGENRWGIYNCTDSVNACQFYLILQDDGNMCIYNSQTGKYVWGTGTNGKQFKKGNVKAQAKKGKYGRNYLLSNEILNVGEWIGSNNGALKLVMQADGNLVLYTSESYYACATFDDGREYSIYPHAIAVYQLPNKGTPDNVGKMGYIDGNGNINPYTDNVIAGAGNKYTFLPNTDIPGSLVRGGNDMSGMPLQNSTGDKCAIECDNNPTCFGYLLEKNTNNCYLKNINTYRSNQVGNQNTDLYIRKNVTATNIDPSCALPTKNVDSNEWNKYSQKSVLGNAQTRLANFFHNNPMFSRFIKKNKYQKQLREQISKTVTSDDGCKDLSLDPHILALKEDLERKQEIAHKLSIQLSQHK